MNILKFHYATSLGGNTAVDIANCHRQVKWMNVCSVEVKNVQGTRKIKEQYECKEQIVFVNFFQLITLAGINEQRQMVECAYTARE